MDFRAARVGTVRVGGALLGTIVFLLFICSRMRARMRGRVFQSIKKYILLSGIISLITNNIPRIQRDNGCAYAHARA